MNASLYLKSLEILIFLSVQKTKTALPCSSNSIENASYMVLTSAIFFSWSLSEVFFEHVSHSEMAIRESAS